VWSSGAITRTCLVRNQLELQAEGQKLALRFPAGFRSTVNMKLSLFGPVGAPMLSGDVAVLRSIYLPQIDSQQALLGLAAAGGGGVVDQGAVGASNDTLPI